MYLKIIWDTFDREILTGNEHRPLLENLTAPLFQGGTGALVTVAAASFLPVNDFIAGEFERNFHVLWLATILAALFVVLQYSVVLNKYFLRGYSWKNLFRKVFLPGFWAEMILVPLAMVMTIVYHSFHQVSFPFIFLIATYIIVNFIFSKLSDATARLDEKVKDLQALNELGRTICSSLLADDLVPTLADRTLAVVERGQAVVVQVWNDESAAFETYVHAVPGFDASTLHKPVIDSLTAWAVDNHATFVSHRLQSPRESVHLSLCDGHKLDEHSWLGVPVQVYEETIGVLLIFAEQQEAFKPSDVGLLQMISQQAAVALKNSRLYVMATVDGLTRLYARRYFDRRLAEEVARAQRYSTNFSLMLIDFDDFKTVNDTYGHAVGDAVLRKIGEVLLAEVRALDIAARYGGDEFAIILPEVNWRGAVILAQRIQQRARRETVRAGDNLVSITLSIGLASFPEHASKSPAQLIAAADTALYSAKSKGKDQIAVLETVL